MNKLKAALDVANQEKELLLHYQEKYSSVEKVLSEQQNQLKELEIQLSLAEREKNDIKVETSSLIKKLKNDAIYKENLVWLLLHFDDTVI